MAGADNGRRVLPRSLSTVTPVFDTNNEPTAMSSSSISPITKTSNSNASSSKEGSGTFLSGSNNHSLTKKLRLDGDSSAATAGNAAGLLSRLQAFLPEMKKANEDLLKRGNASASCDAEILKEGEQEGEFSMRDEAQSSKSTSDELRDLESKVVMNIALVPLSKNDEECADDENFEDSLLKMKKTAIETSRPASASSRTKKKTPAVSEIS